MQLLLVFLTFVLGIAGVFGRPGFLGTEQEWGYVTVREKAHMFWWLFYTNATHNYLERPLIIWLQGGPGGSGTGIGNFEEIGPFDTSLQPRNTSWVNYANVLFVDNPVGTGFSYVEDASAFATTNEQIAEDFLILMQEFYMQLPQFEKVPLYIFCESYGGKMTAEIALVLSQAIKNRFIRADLIAIGLGDSWVAPYEIVSSWPQYLWNVGAIDSIQLEGETEAVSLLKKYVDDESWDEATDQWSTIESLVEQDTVGISFYNILEKIPEYSAVDDRKLNILEKIYKPRLFNRKQTYETNVIMNQKVRNALNLSRYWTELSQNVFNALYEEFMKPAVDVVERLLNETDVNVVIYNGQLDLICATPGVIKYVNKLKWKNSLSWNNTNRAGFAVNNVYEGYVKKFDKLAFYWVNRAGHRVPHDNPPAMQHILEQTTNNFTV